MGGDKILMHSLLEDCGELMGRARSYLTQALQLSCTTATEKHVAAELHYALAFQGIFDQLWNGILFGSRTRVSGSYQQLWLDFLGNLRSVNATEKHKIVETRAPAVRSLDLLRDVYGQEAKTDFRFGVLKVYAALQGAMCGDLLFRDF